MEPVGALSDGTREATDLPAHEHEDAYLSFPLAGAYEERIGFIRS